VVKFTAKTSGKISMFTLSTPSLGSAGWLLLISLSLMGCQTAPSHKSVQTDKSSDNVAVVAVEPIQVTEEEAPLDLEQRVSNLENQMAAAQPTLKKVEAIDKHFKSLSLELDRISQDYSVSPVVEKKEHTIEPKPAVKVEKKAEVQKQVEKKEPVKKSPYVFSVTSVRIGEQPKNITRIVLDTTEPAQVNYDLDNAEGLLVIEIPKAQWKTTQQQIFQKSPMLKSFRASSDDKGARLVADLKQTAKVIATARLKPSGDNGHRVYIDIAPAQ
jgi:hypothetical protein